MQKQLESVKEADTEALLAETVIKSISWPPDGSVDYCGIVRPSSKNERGRDLHLYLAGMQK